MSDDPVYQLSALYAPPRISVRDAQLIDDYGYYIRPINHSTPADVSREDLECYGAAWVFMDLESQLFYLHAITSMYLQFPWSLPWPEPRDSRFLGAVESYLRLLEVELRDAFATLTSEDQSAIREAVSRIYQKEVRLTDNPFPSKPFLQELVIQKMLDDPGD